VPHHHHHHQKQIEGKEKEKFGTILSRPQPLSPGITPKAVRILILFDVPRWIVVFNSAVRKIALVSFTSPHRFCKSHGTATSFIKKNPER
jgi:hypothetical protein